LTDVARIKLPNQSRVPRRLRNFELPSYTAHSHRTNAIRLKRGVYTARNKHNLSRAKRQYLIHTLPAAAFLVGFIFGGFPHLVASDRRSDKKQSEDWTREGMWSIEIKHLRSEEIVRTPNRSISSLKTSGFDSSGRK
jgi:hypothetical protein